MDVNDTISKNTTLQSRFKWPEEGIQYVGIYTHLSIWCTVQENNLALIWNNGPNVVERCSKCFNKSASNDIKWKMQPSLISALMCFICCCEPSDGVSIHPFNSYTGSPIPADPGWRQIHCELVSTGLTHRDHTHSHLCSSMGMTNWPNRRGMSVWRAGGGSRSTHPGRTCQHEAALTTTADIYTATEPSGITVADLHIKNEGVRPVQSPDWIFALLEHKEQPHLTGWESSEGWSMHPVPGLYSQWAVQKIQRGCHWLMTQSPRDGEVECSL